MNTLALAIFAQILHDKADFGDGALFSIPTPPPLKRAKTLRETDAATRPQWSRYHPKDRIPCDECIALLHEAGGIGPYARSARWKCKTGTEILLLCSEHTDARRKEAKP